MNKNFTYCSKKNRIVTLQTAGFSRNWRGNVSTVSVNQTVSKLIIPENITDRKRSSRPRNTSACDNHGIRLKYSRMIPNNFL